MYYVYVLRSEKYSQCYIGSTNDLQRRIREHNDGKSFATQSRRPFELIYYEAYKGEGDARKRESSLKLRSRAYTQLKKRLRYSLA